MRTGTIAGLVALAVVPDLCACLPATAKTMLDTAKQKPACVSIEVKPGLPLQLRVEQPYDLELVVTGPESDSVAHDQFEFGPESLTFIKPGQYRVEFRAAKKDIPTTSTLVMWCEPLALQIAEKFHAAELVAALSTRSGKREDMVASLELWQDLQDQSRIARTMLKIADHDLNSNLHAEARETYRKAADICRDLGDKRCLAEAENNGTQAAVRLGDLNAAIFTLPDVAKLWRALGMPVGEGKTRSNLGSAYSRSGDFGKAISELRRAAALLEGRDPTGHALAVNNLGICYLALADLSQAFRLFSEALAEFGPEYQLKSVTRMNQALVRMRQGDLRDARKYLDLGLVDLEKEDRVRAAKNLPPNRPIRADLLSVSGLISLQQRDVLRQGDVASAKKELEEALQITRETGYNRTEATVLHTLGLAASESRDYVKARRFLSDAADLRRKIGLRDNASDSLLELAKVESASGNRDAAMAAARQALQSIESVRADVPTPELRASYYGRKRAVFDTMVDLAMEDRHDSGAAGLLAAEQGRGRALTDLLAEGPLATPQLRTITARKRDIDRQVSFVSQSLHESRPALRPALEDKLRTLMDQSDSLAAEIAKEAAKGNLAPPATSVDAIADRGLPDDSVLLEYHLGEKASYLWALRRDRLESYRLPARSEVEKLATRFTRMLNNPAARQADPARKEFESVRTRLSEMLLGPVRSTLPSRILFALDGALNHVSMDALRIQGADYLGLKYDVGRTPSASFLLSGMQPRPISAFARTALAVVDPVFSTEDDRVDSKPPSQPAAGDPLLLRLFFAVEVKRLQELVPTNRLKVLRGFEAAPAVLARESSSAYAFWHFSTHSIIDEAEPERSRIILSLVGDSAGKPSNGNLYPRGVANLRLNGATVVLSTCESALGKQIDGEGLQGFTQSFFAAGASQLVMSVSKVEAPAAALYFDTVYSSVMGSGGMSVEHAMRLARLRLSRHSTYSDPFYWAAFFLVGRPVVGQSGMARELARVGGGNRRKGL